MLLESTGLSSESLPRMFVHISMITCNLFFAPPRCWTEFVVTCLVLQSADWAKLWWHQIFAPVLHSKASQHDIMNLLPFMLSGPHHIHSWHWSFGSESQVQGTVTGRWWRTWNIVYSLEVPCRFCYSVRNRTITILYDKCNLMFSVVCMLYWFCYLLEIIYVQWRIHW